MSIVPLDKIPTTAKKTIFREMIEKDLRYAIENNILRFEFTGDYNYKNLANYSKEVYRYFVFKDFYIKKLKELAKQYNISNPDKLELSWYKYNKFGFNSFKTYTICDNTGIRVFGEFNLNVIEEMYEQMEKDAADKRK